MDALQTISLKIKIQVQLVELSLKCYILLYIL